MSSKFRSLPIKFKMAVASMFVNAVVFLINIILLIGINNVSDRINSIYEANLDLNELSASVSSVQESMTEYLKTKTSDSLENYYRAAQDYAERIGALPETVSGSATARMERNLKSVSERYLNETDQTIEGKRGRNVEKYRTHYEEASTLFGYINTYIYSLNNSRFIENAEDYSKTVELFQIIEAVIIAIMVLVVITNGVLIMSLTASITQPLTELKGMADEVTGGNYAIEPIKVDADDEIGVVSKAFNGMVVSVRESIEKIRENAEEEQRHKEREMMMESHLKDAQLRYLQAQINPHFLFNTLNAGAQLAMMEDADRTYRYIQVMSDFFRYNVKSDAQNVTVRDEVELIDNYIYILNVRFSGEIGYEKEIDETLLDTPVPNMILQPLVENCINHGIRDMAGSGRITIRIWKEADDTPCISVSDNGKGMTEEQIRKILSGEKISGTAASSNGIGMDNVIARLRLFTGDADALEIRSAGEGKGTEFIIRLRQKEEADV